MDEIRMISAADVIELQKISIATFKDTFARDNEPQNIQDYLNEAFQSQKLIAELENPDSHFYFFEKNQQVAGYLKLNIGAAQTEDGFENALEIERIYVKKAFQKQGIGQKLYRFALERAKMWRKDKIWLGVWEHNENAKAFYKHLGFELAGSHSFMLGTDNQTDLLLVKDLTRK